MLKLEILQGDCLDILKTLSDESVNCCVTSPPYFGLRDYGMVGQIGMESTPEEFTAALVRVFSEVKRILKPDGTLWLNLGDSYNGSGKGGVFTEASAKQATNHGANISKPMRLSGIKPKDLIGVPWLVAFALRTDGWYLRSDIIWSKPNPMPESVTDRPTKAHEYIFLMSKSARYYYDAAAIAESCLDTEDDVRRIAGVESGHKSEPTEQRNGLRARHLPGNKSHKGTTAYENGDEHHRTKAGLVAYATRVRNDRFGGNKYQGEKHSEQSVYTGSETRNKRTVWEVTTKPYSEAHFATFPPDLIEPCIKAGCPEGGTVLDPFSGAGTTGLVASRFNRSYLGIELNPAYVEMSKKRIEQDAPMFNRIESAKDSEVATQENLL